ncbi:endonuclease/exonuclease/phosphatase family protein [Conyzicola sp.]|uniref:endonuclease/exonuclease/phosphatase family protein n=1 Tax=Conyzicola sp. TaxID=1969404 RepID=UPI003989A50B
MDGEQTVIRAATWNVWWIFGDEWHLRERGIVATLEDWNPDIVGLQEAWALGDRTQPDALGEELGMYSAFVEPGIPVPPDPVQNPDQYGVRMGLGLLSRWPITMVEAHPMPSQGRDLVALIATVAHPLGPLHVVVGATSWEPDRLDEHSAQLAELGEIVSGPLSNGELPSLLLADLNADFAMPAMARLRETLIDTWGDANDFTADPRTFSDTNTFATHEAKRQFNRRIDHVMARPGRAARPVTVVGSWIVRDEPDGLPPSDHYLVVTDLRV